MKHKMTAAKPIQF